MIISLTSRWSSKTALSIILKSTFVQIHVRKERLIISVAMTILISTLIAIIIVVMVIMVSIFSNKHGYNICSHCSVYILVE